MARSGTNGGAIQDNQCVRNCDDPDPKKRAHFEQPVVQTAQMFIGEAGCWLVVALIQLYNRYVSRAKDYETIDTVDPDDDGGVRSSLDAPGEEASNKGMSILRGMGVTLLALPAICDIIGTTLMNAGLLLVAASIYQMTRGALVLFVGLFSVLFLRRRLHLFQWLSLVGVVVGVALVGLAGAIYPDSKGGKSAAEPADISADALRAIIGVFLIASAQIFTATQFVLEEFLLERSSLEPLFVVAWEGTFGFIVTVAGMIILHLAIGQTEAGRNGYFDMVEGWRQMTSDSRIFISSILIMISIG